MPASARRRAVATAAETDGRRRRRRTFPSRLTVRVYRFDIALPRAPKGAGSGVEAAEEREGHTAEDIGGRGRSLADELPTAPNASHVGDRLRADVPALIRYGVDVDSCDAHAIRWAPCHRLSRVSMRRGKKRYSDHHVRFSTPAPWPALSYSQRHGRCNLMGGAMPISRSAVRFLGSIFLDRALPRSGATHPTHGTRLSIRQRPTGEGV